jgi:hypothetical protein
MTSCIIKSPNQINLIIKFKSHNLHCPNPWQVFKPFVKPILSNPPNCACCCVQMAVTIAEIIENVCLSRRQKAEHVTYKNRVQTLASYALPVAQKPDQAPSCPESVQHCNPTSKVSNDQLCVETGHMKLAES